MGFHPPTSPKRPPKRPPDDCRPPPSWLLQPSHAHGLTDRLASVEAKWMWLKRVQQRLDAKKDEFSSNIFVWPLILFIWLVLCVPLFFFALLLVWWCNPLPVFPPVGGIVLIPDINPRGCKKTPDAMAVCIGFLQIWHEVATAFCVADISIFLGCLGGFVSAVYFATSLVVLAFCNYWCLVVWRNMFFCVSRV